MRKHRCILCHDQSTAWSARERTNGLLDLFWVTYVNRLHFYAHISRRCLNRTELADSGRYVRIPQDRHPCHVRRDLLEKFQPLASDVVIKGGKASDIAARPRQTCDQPSTDRIG